MEHNSNYPKGSEWRVWDLHVHTPASFHWDGGKRFKEMDQNEIETTMCKLYETIEKSESAVFCIMDYWTFEGYIKLKNYVNNKNLTLSKTVLPGMELRIQAPTDFRLNIHAVLSDKLTFQQLNDFKSSLKILSTGRTLSEEAIIEFARTLDASKARKNGSSDPDKLNNTQLLELGCKTVEIDTKSFKEAFSIVENYGFVYMPFDTSDGLESLSWEKHPCSDNYYMQLADIFETRSQDSIDLMVGKKTEKNKHIFENFYKTLGGVNKPGVCGSDAHRFADYGKFPSNKKCWIKANPNFEGLKQVIYEPEDRVFIGDEPELNKRVHNNPTKYIRSLKIDQNNNHDATNGIWFKDEIINFNSELVALIGNKGSGKSAITDIIGLLGNSYSKNYITRNGETEELFSFLNRNKFLKYGLASKYCGELHWYAGDPEIKILNEDTESFAPEKV
ncbi:MAG: hypothetical protein ACM3MI_03485, partial [Clostridiales bacterium]